MNRFDVVLKNLFERRLRTGILAKLTGLSIVQWAPTELSETRSRHVDLLGRTKSGKLIHVEFQTTNDPEMAFRMAEYALAIYKRYGEFPEQLVIYLGRLPMQMPQVFAQGGLRYECRFIDIRDLDSAALLSSRHVEDNILAILTRVPNVRVAVCQILSRIGEQPERRKRTLITELLVLAGLRDMRGIIEKEVSRMALTIDINEHTIFGPMLRKATERGIEKGVRKGLEQGRITEARELCLSLATRKFGKLPVRIAMRIDAMTTVQLAQLSLKVLDATRPEDLFS